MSYLMLEEMLSPAYDWTGRTSGRCLQMASTVQRGAALVRGREWRHAVHLSYTVSVHYADCMNQFKGLWWVNFALGF